MQIQKPPFPFADYQAVMFHMFPCEHDSRELRSWQAEDLRWIVYYQCCDCGKLFRRAVSHKALGGVPPSNLPPCDMEAARLFEDSYYGASADLRDRINHFRKTTWWKEYSDYLQSDEWRQRANASIKAAGGVCAYCGIRRAVQVHHLTYDRVGCELPEDLKPVCIPCHRQLHPKGSF